MKHLFKTISILLILNILLIACSGNDSKRNSNFIPPMTIEIADAVKNDSALVEVIKSSEKAINEFSDNIEQLAIDGKEILKKSKNGEEAGMMDQIKAGKLMIEFASNSTQMVASMEKFKNYMSHQKEQGMINDTQLEALEQVGRSFKKRIEQINKKYEHYFEK